MWEYLMKDAQDIVALLDEEGRILSTSKGMVSFTGIPESEQVGSLITTIEHPANRERLMDVFETVRALGFVSMDNFEYKLWDGQVRYCSGSIYKLIGGNYLVIAHDVTQRRKRELDLEVYGGMVAHELRTPLTAINGYVDFMLRRGGLPEEDEDSLKKIRMSTERIDKTAQALLDISRVGREATPHTLVDTQEVAEEIIDSLSSTALEKGAKIVIPVLLPEVRYIEEDMKLILSNLLSNAFKYGGGEEGLPVIISWRGYPGRYVFHVKDFGPGIPDAIKDKVIAPFFRSEESDGMGLGLALVRRVVESHGGDFWFESWENEGSTFYFSVKD
jgi:PAS domain S-box-containing protein